MIESYLTDVVPNPKLKLLFKSYFVYLCKLIQCDFSFFTITSNKDVYLVDMKSIMKGFMQQKGDVEFVVAKPITREELEYCDTFEKNEKFTHLADIIDERIYSNYKLFKTNYIAHDILHSSNRFADRYTADQKKDFEEYMHSGILALEFPHHEDIENIFLHIYANPVDNCLKFQQ